jgi:hypothetical protein
MLLNHSLDLLEAFYNGSSDGTQSYRIGRAHSINNGVEWLKHPSNPILSPVGTPGSGWDSVNVKEPYCIKVGGTYYLFTLAAKQTLRLSGGLGWQPLPTE